MLFAKGRQGNKIACCCHGNALVSNYYILNFLLFYSCMVTVVRSWCMRYEAKHHYFKRLAIVIGNLSMYHTCWQKDTKRGFVIGYNLQKVVQVHLLTKGLKLVQVKNVCL